MDSSLLILEPPYQVVRRLHDSSPELGAVVLLDALERRPSTQHVKAQLDVAPWCPLCILAEEESGMRATRRLPRTCLVYGPSDDDGAAGILRAVASRPRPTSSDLVEWLVKRTRLSMVSRTLAELLSRPLLRRNEVSFLPYSIREQLRQLGSWGALEWQRAAALADLAADRTAVNRIVSADEPVASETRRWMHDLLGLSERAFHERFGWEWVLEASLRRSGFFETRSTGIRSLHAFRALAPAGAERRAGSESGVRSVRRATA